MKNKTRTPLYHLAQEQYTQDVGEDTTGFELSQTSTDALRLSHPLITSCFFFVPALLIVANCWRSNVVLFVSWLLHAGPFKVGRGFKRRPGKDQRGGEIKLWECGDSCCDVKKSF